MIEIRDARTGDVLEILDLAASMHAESPVHHGRHWDAGRVQSVIETLIDSADGIVLTAVESPAPAGMERRMLGFMGGMVIRGYLSGELEAEEVALYVVPEKRGGMLAACLVKRFVERAFLMGATVVNAGISNGQDMEMTRGLYEKLGFRTVGYQLALTPQTEGS